MFVCEQSLQLIHRGLCIVYIQNHQTGPLPGVSTNFTQVHLLRCKPLRPDWPEPVAKPTNFDK